MATSRTGSLLDTRFAVVDVETSGLKADRHRLLQIAVVRATADGRIIDRWVTFLRPGFHRLGAVEIHGLTRRHLRGAPRFADVASELVARLDGSVMVAHNLSFDWAFLQRALRRAGYPPPDAERLCTLALSRSTDEAHERSHRLADLTARYGIPLLHAHDAEADAVATAALLPHLFAAAGLQTADDLAAHVRGTTRAWPAPVPPRRLARWRPGRWRPTMAADGTPAPLGPPSQR